MIKAHFIQLKLAQEEQINTCLFLISCDTNRQREEELFCDSFQHLEAFPYHIFSLFSCSKEQFEVIFLSQLTGICRCFWPKLKLWGIQESEGPRWCICWSRWTCQETQCPSWIKNGHTGNSHFELSGAGRWELCGQYIRI